MKKAFYPLAAILVILADQITKYMVRDAMQPGDKIPVIGDWMNIYYVQNTGTAFSMFEGNKLVTIALTSVLIIGCICYAIYEAGNGHSLISLMLTLIASGGASNMIDRIALGFVTDMISCGSFAVFNIADIFVTCSCILMIIIILFMFKNGEEL